MDLDAGAISVRFQRSISVLYRMINSEMLKQMDGDVTGTQLYMLYYIRESKQCRLTALAEKLDVKPSAVTVMIDRLVKSGHVIRTHDTVDRRVILAQLTEEGHAILHKAHIIRQAVIGAYMSKLSAPESEVVTDLLEKIVVAAQDENL